MEHFRVLLDPLWRSLGWLGGHFGASLVAFVENMGPYKIYEIHSFFVVFSWVGGCLEGPGWSLWMVLAISLLVD